VRAKTILLVAVSGLIILNLFTFIAAYPQTLTTAPLPGAWGNPTPLAKDFSAYYIGAWRLVHDPSQVFTLGFVNDGEPSIYPHPEPYKYLPSFLLLIAPLLLVSYQRALTIFDVFQLLLLPLIACMTYKLVNKKGVAVTLIVSVLVLLQPSPLPHWSFSVTYYWQWAEGQAKVFETFLLLLSFYLGSIGKPRLSGVALALSAFDPRFAIVALPLFVMYNKDKILASVTTLVGTLVVSNVMLLYPGLGAGFLAMSSGSGITTPLYPYALIPLLTVLSISVLNGKEIVIAMRALLPFGRQRSSNLW
jgi:hypothetical protein